MNENEIRDVLGEGIGEEPPIAGGPAAVFAGARSHAVRTRAAAGALSVVAVLGVAAGAVALSEGSSGVPAGTSAASSGAPLAGVTTAAVAKTDQCPTGVTAGLPVLSADRNPARAAEGQVPLDPRSVTELLKRALPCGTPTAYVGQDQGSSPEGGVSVYGAVEVTDHAGVGSVSVWVQGHGQSQKSMVDCKTRKPADRATLCENTVTADGTAILVEEMPDKRPGGVDRMVTLLFSDGHMVTVAEENMNMKFFQPAGTPLTRAVPPLTLDQLRDLAVGTPWPLTVSRDFAQDAKKDLVGYIDSDTVRPPANSTGAGTK